MWKLVEQPLWESAEWSQIMMSKHNATFEEGDTSVQTLLICHLNTYITKRTTMMLLSFSGADKRRSQPGMQILSTRLSVGCLMNIIICETCWTFFFFFPSEPFSTISLIDANTISKICGAPICCDSTTGGKFEHSAVFSLRYHGRSSRGCNRGLAGGGRREVLQVRPPKRKRLDCDGLFVELSPLFFNVVVFF